MANVAVDLDEYMKFLNESNAFKPMKFQTDNSGQIGILYDNKLDMFVLENGDVYRYSYDDDRYLNTEGKQLKFDNEQKIYYAEDFKRSKDMGILAAFENAEPECDYDSIQDFADCVFGDKKEMDDDKLLEILRDAKFEMKEALKRDKNHACKELVDMVDAVINDIEEERAQSISRKDVDKAQKLVSKLEEAYDKEWNARNEVHEALYNMVNKAKDKTIAYGNGLSLVVKDRRLYFRIIGEKDITPLWEAPMSSYLSIAANFLDYMKKNTK